MYCAQSGWYWKPNVKLMNNSKAKTPLQWWPNTPQGKAKYVLNTFRTNVELDSVVDYMTRQAKNKNSFIVYHTSHLGHDVGIFEK